MDRFTLDRLVPDRPVRVQRRVPSGIVLGPEDGASVARALSGYLQDGAGRARRIRPGVRTGVVLLGAPLAEVLLAPRSALVRGTWP